MNLEAAYERLAGYGFKNTVHRYQGDDGTRLRPVVYSSGTGALPAV
ncbi:MAG: hypothetical protein H0X71_09375 [Rubrobacter sp.]|nr:hypothetical protein [Rubrobacter sp.]